VIWLVSPLSSPFLPFGPMPASSSVEASKDAICYVRFTSTPAVSFAQTPAIRRPLGERGKSDPLLPFRIGPLNGRDAQESGLRSKAEVAPSHSLRCSHPKPLFLSLHSAVRANIQVA
jgi:hypothetical protein